MARPRIGWKFLNSTIKADFPNFKLYGCSYKLQARFSEVSDTVDIYICGSYDHSQHQSSFRHPEGVLDIAKDAAKLELQPCHVKQLIRENGYAVPDQQQMWNLMHRVQKSVVATGPATVGELEDFCRPLSQLPEMEDPSNLEDPAWHRPYIPLFNSSPDSFHIHITTRHLATILAQAKTLQTDATFKLNWHKYPCIVSGAQDCNRRFHPISFDIVRDEENEDVYNRVFMAMKANCTGCGLPEPQPQFFLGDGHASITASVKTAFPNARRLMCWFYMKQAVERQWSRYLSNEQWSAVEKQICDLQVAPSDSLFNTASILLVNEWHHNGKAEWARYFYDTYINGPLRFWYEGAAPYFGTTNNGLEGTNSGLKKTWTNRSVEQMDIFLPRMLEMFESWSSSSMKDGFQSVPTLQLKHHELGRKYAGDETNEFIPLSAPPHNRANAGHAVKGSQSSMDLQTYLNYSDYPQWYMRRFADYQHWRHQWHLVHLAPGGFYTCTCYSGLKAYRCKHSIGFELREKILDLRPEALLLPIRLENVAAHVKQQKRFNVTNTDFKR